MVGLLKDNKGPQLAPGHSLTTPEPKGLSALVSVWMDSLAHGTKPHICYNVQPFRNMMAIG